jgi:hypothetical protein
MSTLLNTCSCFNIVSTYAIKYLHPGIPFTPCRFIVCLTSKKIIHKSHNYVNHLISLYFLMYTFLCISTLLNGEHCYIADRHYYEADRQSYCVDRHCYGADRQSYCADRHCYGADRQSYGADGHPHQTKGPPMPPPLPLAQYLHPCHRRSPATPPPISI